MSIISKIEDDIKSARLTKSSDTLISLQTLLGAIQNLPKNKYNDEGAISKIKASLDGIEVMLSSLPSSDARVEKLTKEKELLSSYMPKMLTNEEVDIIIKENSLNNIKDAMAFFNKEYPGKINRAYVSSKYLKK